MVLDMVNLSVLKIIEPYRKWIIENPQLLSDMENTVQYLPYFTAGQFNNSTFVSELLYSFSNLIVLFNDLLMCGGKCVHLKFSQFESKIKIWLTVIEYTEVLCEISAKKLWGQTGRWFIIIVIQIFKTMLRLLLIHLYKERVIKSPPIQPLNREKLNDSHNNQLKEGFALKRSGTIVRSVRGATCPSMRTWEPLFSNDNDDDNLSKPTSGKNLALAETLYIMKPLFHLGCISFTGEKYWPPWLLSLTIDLLSLKLINNEAESILFSKEEEKEFFRRRIGLLLYILKSPFYDKYSCIRIYAILTALSTKVPLAKFLTEPIKKYLPHWQNTYFYMWSS
ncbi:Peroxisomal membrane protein PEX16 [Eufriesea mexicana]|uniref:Peroxisomal membrane protein PEX16 n=1 Tax=Eufriesea mexicana TaxID=516756 RepID=A0A310S804_9HYME|nr:PREDICTED: peroxisomal membrane protein PEX16 [Eufriesea mexicana]OAD54251.1 Peroxisomal membrane protein PEX16 [Eufriesea mexicana]